MSNRSTALGISFITLGLAAGATLAQPQDGTLTSWYAQQATQVRTLVEQLGSSDPDRQKFALWQLELELAVPADQTTQPMLEEAAAAGLLPILADLSSSADSDVAGSAGALHTSVTAALGLAARPTQPLAVLDGVASETLLPGAHESWLALDVEAGKEYRVRASDCELVSALVVSADDLSVIDGGFSVSRGFAFTSEANDSVLLRVRPAHCSSAGTVNLWSGAPLQKIEGSLVATDAMPAVEGRYFGSLTDNEQQWLSLSVPAGQSIEITADPGASELDTYLTLYDATGLDRLAEDDDGGTGLGSRLSYTSTTDAELLIEVSRFGSSWGEYELTIASVEPPGERGRLISEGVLYPGSLVEGGREWWRFEPAAGVRYRLDVAPYDGLDTYIKVYEIDGTTLIDEDDDGGNGLGSRLDFSRTTNSPLLIEVYGLSGEAGSYRLTLSEHEMLFAHDEEAITVGDYRGNVAGSAESFWRLATPAGRYRVEIVPHGGLDSVITLYEGDASTELDYDDDGGQGYGSQLDFTSATATTHVLAVGALSGGGNFELKFTALPNPADDAELAERGGVYRSYISTGGERWWRVNTRAGSSYDFEALPRDDLDSVMELYAADGLTQLDYDDDGGQGFGSRINHWSEADGFVLVRVTGLGSSVGDFELIVR